MLLSYKIITAVLAATGCLSLLITGQLNPLMTTGGIVLIPGYYRLLKGYQPAPQWVVGTFSVMTLAVFFIDFTVISGDVFLAVAHLTVVFQAIKSFDLREPWDHLQVYFMSLLQLIIASELTSSIVFGIVFIVFMVMLVTAMIFSHFLKSRSLGKVSIKLPVVIISVLTIALTVLFFVAMPRTQHKLFGKSHAKKIKTVGFSENVDFGSFGDVKTDPSVVMRVEMDTDLKIPYYWRGLAMDYFNGLSWSNTAVRKSAAEKNNGGFMILAYAENPLVEQKVYLEPIDSEIIFGLAEVSRVSASFASLVIDDAMGMYMPRRSPRGISYTVYSAVNGSNQMKKDKKYLQIPPGMERVKSLAGEIISGTKGDLQKSAMIEEHLRNNYVYSLNTTAPPAGSNPVEDFLFNTKKGYCEHYATSMVIMLRSLGIPARIVNGFYGGEKNRYGQYVIVRQSNAHSWVEAFIEDRWMRFDPTPSSAEASPALFLLFLDSLKLSWSRYVVGFSSDDQKEIIRTIYSSHKLPEMIFLKTGQIKMRGALLLLLIVIAVLMFLVLKKASFRKHGMLTSRYLEMRKFIEKAGVPISPSLTAGDLKRKTSHLKTADDVAAFLELYEKHRFGSSEMGMEDKKKYLEILQKIKRSG